MEATLIPKACVKGGHWWLSLGLKIGRQQCANRHLTSKLKDQTFVFLSFRGSHFVHKFLQVAITFFVFGLGKKLHITQCALIVHCLFCHFWKPSSLDFIFVVDVVANIEVVVINPNWDAFQTIVVDSIKDFISPILVVKWKCVH